MLVYRRYHALPLQPRAAQEDNTDNRETDDACPREHQRFGAVNNVSQNGYARSEASVARPAQDLQDNEFVCIQHWRPQPGDPCLRIFQGERLIVTWSDETDQSWVYGHAIDEPQKQGYFPKAVLKKPKCASISRHVGDIFIVDERFEAPEEVGGYLSIQVGERVKILCDMEAPSAWAYAERYGYSSPPASEIVGWIPEVCLSATPSLH
eukprot:TRINITY_DN31121_c0_g1_i2.p1 TRINITY_DN31121_c0_g1~~TRINITY_DN31121_c0_g1_i2.p1  ORF type:complete len:208 (-),score=18.85 TRINITY_DN31121_c0_g1_i2:31-654(-)